MKKIVILSILSLSLLVLHSCNSSKNVKGNKNIVQKEIPISEYDKIEINHAVEVIYTQNESIPAYLNLEIDSNLIEHLDISVNGTSLNIKSQRNTSLKPTNFVIHTNSKNLKDIAIGGSGSITGNGKLKTSDLKISIAGSGGVKFDNLEANSTNIKIAGSGNATLSGTATQSVYSIAGSGNIYTKGLVQDSVVCKIAGSGNIEVNAKESLKNSIAGSGDIKYIGNPKVTNSIAGSGKIKQID